MTTRPADPMRDSTTRDIAPLPMLQPVMREHGGNIYQASGETGIPIGEIRDFSASINPLGVPDSVAQAIGENIRYLPHYPDPCAGQLAMHLAKRLDIDPQTILCGNGSTELIYLVARALVPRRVLVPVPTFSEYERACGMTRETFCVRHALSRENNFDLDPHAFIAAMTGCDMAFLCNPNNPTGRLITRDAVLAIARAARRLSCYLVVDEAFIDFTPGHSVLDEVAGNSHLVVLRSLTKYYALSGLRIGYGVFPQPLIGLMQKFKEPWTINTLAQKAGIAALNDRRYQEKTVAVIAEAREFFEKGLSALGIPFVPSAANYYLLRLDKEQDVIGSLRKKGILVRDCSNFEGLDGAYIRVAVRSLTENAVLLKELAKLCAA